MSAQGLQDYMDGARGMVNLGKGAALVVTWLDEMPLVVKECGEDIIRDVASAILKLASMVSGEVLVLVLQTLPTVASRLGDPDLLRGYLQLLHRLSAKAPRGLRPMLGVIDELLSKLTLSGLRRWVDFGAEAYRRDLPKQASYFGLESDWGRECICLMPWTTSATYPASISTGPWPRTWPRTWSIPANRSMPRPWRPPSST